MRIDNKFCIYKKNALRFTMWPQELVSHSVHQNLFVMDEYGSGVSMDMALGTGRPGQSYKWETDKISVRLNLRELGMILNGFQKKQAVELQHNPNMGREGPEGEMKYISFMPPSGSENWLVSITHIMPGKDSKKVMVPIDPAEVRLLIELFKAAIPLVAGWYVPNK